MSQSKHVNGVLGAQTAQWGQNSWDAPKLHLRKLCGNCWEETAGERNEGRARGGRQMASSAVSTLTGRQARKKMQQQPLQMTPWETGVATQDTNSTAWTLQREPDSHLHCQRKGYFWKMGPSLWFNSLTNPRKRGFSPGKAVWFRLRLHFGLDPLSLCFLTFLLTHSHVYTNTHSHNRINSVSISSLDEVESNKQDGMRMFPASVQYIKLTEQTNAMVSICQGCTTFYWIPLDKL